MDFNVLLEDMRNAAANLKKQTSNRKYLSSLYCNKTCKAVDKSASAGTEYENVITGLWLITAHLTEQLDCLERVPGVKDVALRLFRECTKAVLNIQWQNLEEDGTLRQSFLISLANLNAKLVNHDFLRFRLLESLTENPWTDPTLAKIMGGEAEDDEEKEEVRKYIENEDPVILQLRVDMMLKENCEEYAMNLCNSCLTHPELQSDLKLRKTQLTLLHKLGHTDRLQEECQKLSIQDALVIIRQLQAKANREICTVLSQTFMVQNWIRPSDQDANKELLRLWIKQQVQVDKEKDRFKESAWAIAKLSQSTEQVIFFIDVLREQCGGVYLQLYVDMCIFAINVDKGQMETSLRQGNSESAIARKSDMAAICSKLACLVHHTSVKMARMCVLTAFALKPSEESYESVGKFYGEQHNCCGNCTKNVNADPGAVNPATLYEVERLLNMLRPEYLNPDNVLDNVQMLCKRYLQERLKCSKTIFNALPVNSSQVEGPGKKKDDVANSRSYNLYDAVSSHELSSSQVLLSKLRFQSIKNNQLNPPIRKVIYSEPPQPYSAPSVPQNRNWPNILQSNPQRPNPNEASAEQLGNILTVSKQSFSPSVASSNNYRLSFLKQGQQGKMTSPSQHPVPQVKARVTPAAVPSSQRQSQGPHFQQQIKLSVPPGIVRNTELSSFPSNSQNKQISQGVLNITGNAQPKLMTQIKTGSQQQKVIPATLQLQSTGKNSSQQLGAQGLPTVSTLLKPGQNLEQCRPTSKSSLSLQLPSSSLALPIPKNEKPAQQLLQIKRGPATDNQKADNLQNIRFQAENYRNLQATLGLPLPQQKQQVFSKQMTGSVVTINQSSQGLLNVNTKLPTQKGQQKSILGTAPQTSLLNFQSRVPPKVSIQQMLLQKDTNNTQQLTQRQLNPSSSQQNQYQLTLGKNEQQQFDLSVKSSRESLQFPSHSVITSTESDSLNSQSQSALPSDELSGSITGIDDTIIRELLQDSGIFSNTFPDINIEVEDLNKKNQGALQSAVSNRIYSPSRQNTMRSQVRNMPVCQANLMQSSVTSCIDKQSSTLDNVTPSYDLKPQDSLLQFKSHHKPLYKEPHADSNTLNQRQFPEEMKTNVSSISMPQTTESASNLTIVEQLREKMRKEQIEGEVTMDASNNATYRCIICSLAFGELEELREHVRNVCKPGLQSSSVYNNKIEQDRAKSAKAGLETTTVFQCLRCFELCISDVGIKQHRSTCKRVPTVPPDIKNATLKGKTSPSASSSRSSTPKSLIKKDKVPEIPLPFPYPSLNTKAVLESLSAATATSQISPKSGTTTACIVKSSPSKTDSVTSSTAAKDNVSSRENSSKTDKSKSIPPPSYSETSGSGGRKFYRCNVCSQTLCSLESLHSHWKECYTKISTAEKKSVHKSFLYEDDLEPGEIRPLFGRTLENVLSIIAGVAQGNLGNTEDFDSDAEASDFEVLVELKDPCKIPETSNRPPFHRKFPAVKVAVFHNNIQNLKQIASKSLASKPGSITTLTSHENKVFHPKTQSQKYEGSSSFFRKASNCSKPQSGGETDLQNTSENADDSSSQGEGDGSQSSGFEMKYHDEQDSLRGTPPKLRDRNTLKPIQSFINESFISPYDKTGIKKASKKNSVTIVKGDSVPHTPSEDPEEEGFICVACKKHCPNERMLIQHYAGKHLMPYTTKALADGNSYFCHLCQKSFNTFKHYMLHVPNHKKIIYDKMKHSSPRRGTARPWSMRLASSRGLVSRQLSGKMGKLSPKLASALKSKKRAAKSVQDRLRKCLSKQSSLRPSPLLSSGDASSSGESALYKMPSRGLSFKKAERPLPMIHMTRGCESFIPSHPSSENEDSCLSSNLANTDDEDYLASEDLDSDSSPSAPPQTRFRKRSGQRLVNSEVSKRRSLSMSALSISTENKDQILLPVVSVRRISEQEIKKYSKCLEQHYDTPEDVIDVEDPIPAELSSPPMPSFQASFESYIMQALDKTASPKLDHSTSLLPKTPTEESALNNNSNDPDESNTSSDRASLAETEASTLSNASGTSHGAIIKGTQKADEILFSVTKRRCSVNLGQKLDINAIQMMTESTSDDRASLEETCPLPQEEGKSKSSTPCIQPSLFNCAVRLERTELFDKLIPTNEDRIIPDTCGKLEQETEENIAKNELSEEKTFGKQKVTSMGSTNLKEDSSPVPHLNLPKGNNVVKQIRENFVNSSHSSILSSSSENFKDISVSLNTTLESDRIEGIAKTLENTSCESDGPSVISFHQNDNNLKDISVSSVQSTIRTSTVDVDLEAEALFDSQEASLNDVEVKHFVGGTVGECPASKPVSPTPCLPITVMKENGTGNTATGNKPTTLVESDTRQSEDRTVSVCKSIVPPDSLQTSLCDNTQGLEESDPQPAQCIDGGIISSITVSKGPDSCKESVNEMTCMLQPNLDSDSKTCHLNAQKIQNEETLSSPHALSDEEKEDSNSALPLANTDNTQAVSPLKAENHVDEKNFSTEVETNSSVEAVEVEGDLIGSICGPSSVAEEITSLPQSTEYLESFETELHEDAKDVTESFVNQIGNNVKLPQTGLRENIISSNAVAESTNTQSSLDLIGINSQGEIYTVNSGNVGSEESTEAQPSENINSEKEASELQTVTEICSSSNIDSSVLPTNLMEENYEAHSENLDINKKPSAIPSETEVSGFEQNSSEIQASENVSLNEDFLLETIETNEGNAVLGTSSSPEKEEQSVWDDILVRDFDSKIDAIASCGSKRDCKLQSVQGITGSEFQTSDSQVDISSLSSHYVTSNEEGTKEEQQNPQACTHTPKDEELNAPEIIVDSSPESKDNDETKSASLAVVSDDSYRDFEMVSSSDIPSANDDTSNTRDVMKHQTVNSFDLVTSDSVSENNKAVTERKRMQSECPFEDKLLVVDEENFLTKSESHIITAAAEENPEISNHYINENSTSDIQDFNLNTLGTADIGEMSKHSSSMSTSVSTKQESFDKDDMPEEQNTFSDYHLQTFSMENSTTGQNSKSLVRDQHPSDEILPDDPYPHVLEERLDQHSAQQDQMAASPCHANLNDGNDESGHEEGLNAEDNECLGNIEGTVFIDQDCDAENHSRVQETSVKEVMNDTNCEEFQDLGQTSSLESRLGLPLTVDTLVTEPTVSHQFRENSHSEQEGENQHLDSESQALEDIFLTKQVSGQSVADSVDSFNCREPIVQHSTQSLPDIPTESSLETHVEYPSSEKNDASKQEFDYQHSVSESHLALEESNGDKADLSGDKDPVIQHSAQSFLDSPKALSLQTTDEYEGPEEENDKTSYPSENPIAGIVSAVAADEPELPAVQSPDSKEIQKTVEEENSRRDEVPQSMDCSEPGQLVNQQDEISENITCKGEGISMKQDIKSVTKEILSSPEAEDGEGRNSAEVVTKFEVNNRKILPEPFEDIEMNNGKGLSESMKDCKTNDQRTLSESLEGRKTLSEPFENKEINNGKVLSESFEDGEVNIGKSLSESFEDVKTLSEPDGDRKTLSEPFENKEVNSGKAPSEPFEDRGVNSEKTLCEENCEIKNEKMLSEPVEDSEINNEKTLSEPFEDWKDVHTMGKENSLLDTDKIGAMDQFMPDGFEDVQSEKMCDSVRGQKRGMKVKDELFVYNDNPRKPSKSPAAEEDDLSDYDLFIEEDTAYNKNVFNQALMPSGPRNERTKKPVPHNVEGKDRFSIHDDASMKQQFQKFSRGLKSLKERLGPSRFEWDGFDEEIGAKTSKEVSAENTRLLERKQNALKGKSESSPFMWDLEESPEKQEQECADRKTGNTDICKSLSFENVGKDCNDVGVTPSFKAKRGRKPKKIGISDCGEKSQPSKRPSALMKDKPTAKKRKLVNSVSLLTLSAPTQTSSVRQRHRSSESLPSKVKSTEDLPSILHNVKSVNDVIVDDEISFNTKSYSPVPPEMPLNITNDIRFDVKKRGRKKSKKDTFPDAKTANQSSELKSKNSYKRRKTSNLTTVAADGSFSKHEDRDCTESESKRIKLSNSTKPTDPLTPKLKKAGLIRVAKQSPSSSLSSTNALPCTRSSEAALKAFNQKSLRNRKVQPADKRTLSKHSKNPMLPKKLAENLNKQSKGTSPPSLGSTSRSTIDQATGNSPPPRKVTKHAAERSSIPTGAVVKRRTPSLPRKNDKDLLASTPKRNVNKQSTTSTTIYRVDPLPKEAASKVTTSTSKSPSTIHTPLPPGVTTVNSKKKNKQVKTKWKIDSERKPAKAKSKQSRAPISFRKT